MVSASSAISPLVSSASFRLQIAVRHRGHDFGDTADLRGEVRGHEVHVIREILPDAGDASHLRLTAEDSFRADLARHARHFRGERIELVHHRVDGVLQLQNFAAHIHRDFARQVAVRHGGGHGGDVSNLVGQVRRHRVHRFRQILPHTGDAADQRLAAELSFGTDFAGHARHFGGESVELVHHDVDGVLQLQNLAADVHRDFAGKVAVRDGGGHFGDVSHLVRQVVRHRVHRLREILPRAGDALHLRLTAELSFGSDLARHARHFRGETVELVHHRVNGVLELQDLTAHIHRDFARKVAVRDGGGHLGDVSNLVGQVRRHRVHRLGQILPRAGDASHLRLTAEFAFGSDLARHARHFRGETVELVHHGVNGVLELQDLTAHIHRDFARKVARCHGGGHLGDVTNLVGQVRRHRVHRDRQILPDAGDALHFRLTAELAFGSDFARHARHFRGERIELVHHGVDGVLQLQNLAARVDRDLGRKIALRDGGRHAGDVTHLVC